MKKKMSSNKSSEKVLSDSDLLRRMQEACLVMAARRGVEYPDTAESLAHAARVLVRAAEAFE